MSSAADSVGAGIMFLGYRVRPFVRSFVRPFVRSDTVTTISHERLEKSPWAIVRR